MKLFTIFLLLWVSTAEALPAEYVWWKFDEGTGTTTTADSGTCGCPGTLQNSPTWVAGAKGGFALQFNGTNQYVSNVSPSIGTPATIAFWVKANNSTANSTFIFGASTVRLSAHVPYSDNILYWDAGGGGGERVQTSFSAFNNVWTHVAFTTNGTNLREIYVNGTFVVSNVNNTGAPVIAAGLEVGRIGIFPAYHTGAIDEFRAWKSVLTAADILEVFQSGGAAPGKWRMMQQWFERFERVVFGRSLRWLA